jgi:hypothetical protein
LGIQNAAAGKWQIIAAALQAKETDGLWRGLNWMTCRLLIGLMGLPRLERGTYCLGGGSKPFSTNHGFSLLFTISTI